VQRAEGFSAKSTTCPIFRFVMPTPSPKSAVGKILHPFRLAKHFVGR